MSPLRLGVAASAVVAGPPLYAAVQAGALDGTTAAVRAGVIAVACVAGVSYVARLLARYDEDARRTQAAVDGILAAAVKDAAASPPSTDPRPRPAAPGRENPAAPTGRS